MLIDQLKKILVDYKPTAQELEMAVAQGEIRRDFLERFPIERLATLNLKDYCIGTGEKDNLCWWVERGTDGLSKYFPGNATSYGVYWSKDDKAYRFSAAARKLHETHPEWNDAAVLRRAVVEPIAAFIESEGENADAASRAVGRGFLLKLLILYYPDRFIQINSIGWLDKIIDAFDLKKTKSFVEKNRIVKRFYDELKSLPSDGEISQGAFVGRLVDLLDLKGSAEEPSGKDRVTEAPPRARADLSTRRINALEAADLMFFAAGLSAHGLHYAPAFVRRFFAALQAKRFVVLTGLSGSGKTQLALQFCEMFAAGRHAVVPVGADWTNNEKMLGYPDAMQPGRYVKPETGVLDLLLKAAKDPEHSYVLVLDEMNLSHVERYFADFLSAMESKGELKLHGEKGDLDGVPPTVRMPENLWVIGTMNVDETTYMFSPKVLDRAQVLEFRVKAGDMAQFLEGKQADAAAALKGFFPELAKVGAEFGYRTAGEFCSFVENAIRLGCEAGEAVDAAIMQKLLPKLHGSRRQLEKPLAALWKLCLTDGGAASVETLAKVEGEIDSFPYATNCRYPISAEKIARLFKNAKDNGFASYAEA